MLKANYKPFTLQFISPATTSRGVMTEKHGFLLNVFNSDSPQINGVGECSILPGLSYDEKPEYEDILMSLCENINKPLQVLLDEYREWPSLRFGLESALLDYINGGNGILFNTTFTGGQASIPINGLIWMGDHDYMLSQIKRKLADGYNVIKLKVGALDFEKELDLLRYIRRHHPPTSITIRLDANGAFGRDLSNFNHGKNAFITNDGNTVNDIMYKLQRLSEFHIHSIEQPVMAGNTELMAEICRESPIPVALDEELIGHHELKDMENLLLRIRPQYIILKPSLVGGFTACNQWISLCNKHSIGYWITSALESNIGLNAIAQYTSSIETHGLPQGLGTGGLFVNNFDSPLKLSRGRLRFEI